MSTVLIVALAWWAAAVPLALFVGRLVRVADERTTEPLLFIPESFFEPTGEGTRLH